MCGGLRGVVQDGEYISLFLLSGVVAVADDMEYITVV